MLQGPSSAWDTVALDLFGPLPTGKYVQTSLQDTKLEKLYPAQVHLKSYQLLMTFTLIMDNLPLT